MSSREFTYWKAFAELEPYGMQRQDIQAALIAQTVANRGLRPGEMAYRLADFMPQFQPRKRLTTVQDHMEFFRRVAQQVGGKFVSSA